MELFAKLMISRVDKAGHHLFIHIHDKDVIDEPPGARIYKIVTLVTRLPYCVDRLPLNADWYECSIYMKD